MWLWSNCLPTLHTANAVLALRQLPHCHCGPDTFSYVGVLLLGDADGRLEAGIRTWIGGVSISRRSFVAGITGTWYTATAYITLAATPQGATPVTL